MCEFFPLACDTLLVYGGRLYSRRLFLGCEVVGHEVGGLQLFSVFSKERGGIEINVTWCMVPHVNGI